MAMCPICSKQFDPVATVYPNKNKTLCCSEKCANECEYKTEHDNELLRNENEKYKAIIDKNKLCLACGGRLGLYDYGSIGFRTVCESCGLETDLSVTKAIRFSVKKCEKMLTALEFYANAKNWIGYGESTPAKMDNGNIAREAISQMLASREE